MTYPPPYPPRDPHNGVGWKMTLAAFVFGVALIVGMMALGARPLLL